MDGSGSASLNLESLLRAMERVTDAEREYVTSILTYNLASVNLKRANGTLLQSENVSISRNCEDGCKSMELHKGEPVDAIQSVPFAPDSSVPVSGDSLPFEGDLAPPVLYPNM